MLGANVGGDELDDRFGDALRADQADQCDQALPAYHELAEAGLPGAMLNLGRLYQQGRCVEQDFDKARQYFLRAASYRMPDAHANLALLYFAGDLGQPDYPRAFQHWSMAARLGVVYWVELANMHYRGFGTPQDPEAAEALLIEGAIRGDVGAKRRLIEFYQDETGPLYSLEKAAEYDKQ